MEEECQELSLESLKFLESIDIEQLVNYYAELKNLLHIVEPALTVSYHTSSFDPLFKAELSVIWSWN